MQNGPRRAVLHLILAERAGFEPAVGDYPTHAFQACDLNRSSTSPEAAHCSRSAEWVNQMSVIFVFNGFLPDAKID